MDTQTEMIFEEAASMEDMKSEVLSALGKKKDPPSVTSQLLLLENYNKS